MFSTVADAAVEALQGCLDAIGTLREQLDLVQTDDLVVVALAASRVSAQARGLLAAVTAAAVERGVVHQSGSLTPTAWLRDQQTALNEPDAHALVRAVEATRPPALADLRAALLHGAVTPAEATSAARTYDRLRTATDPRVHDSLADAVTALAGNGTGCRDLRRFTIEMLARYGTLDEADARRRHEHAQHAMTAFRPTPDGMWESTIRLGAADKATVAAALDALAAPAPDPDSGERDLRSPAQRRADALVTMARLTARAGTTGPMGATTQVTLHLGPEALLPPCPHRPRTAWGLAAAGGRSCDCPRPGCATDGTGTTLRPEEARELSCGSGVTPLVLDGAGRPLAVGRRERCATAAQRRALEARDGGCSFPGCTAPPAWTQAHHVVHWADGGPTDLDNLALLCGRHHRFVHAQGVTGRVEPDGSAMRWHVTRSPGGWRACAPPPGERRSVDGHEPAHERVPNDEYVPAEEHSPAA